MTIGAMVPLAAGGSFLLAALAHTRGWRVGTWLAAAGAALLGAAVAARGLRAGHWPLASEYEFALAFALGTALVAIALDARPHGRAPAVQAATMLVATALVVYARLGMPAFKRAIQPLPPALDSVWFPLHVGTAALAYGALALAGAAGGVWLLRQASRDGAGRLLHRAVATGYPLLTLSMLLGMVWARVAWGRYWGWDLKEVWTWLIWLVYTLYWHLRHRPGWQGSRLAWLALAGLGTVLFTFLGIGWLARTVGLESLHLF
jgi:ABC-type transport system involved in cytochrome c biogenesis permease subunit